MFIACFTVFLIKLEKLTLYNTLPFFFLSSMFDFFLYIIENKLFILIPPTLLLLLTNPLLINPLFIQCISIIHIR